MLTTKRVIFKKDGFGKSFFNTGGFLVGAVVGQAVGKDFSLPLESIQAIGKEGNNGFQILTSDNQIIKGTFVTSNVFKLGTLKNVCEQFVEYVSKAINELLDGMN